MFLGQTSLEVMIIIIIILMAPDSCPQGIVDLNDVGRNPCPGKFTLER